MMNTNLCNCLIPGAIFLGGLFLYINYLINDEFPVGEFLGLGFMALAVVILLLSFAFSKNYRKINCTKTQ